MKKKHRICEDPNVNFEWSDSLLGLNIETNANFFFKNQEYLSMLDGGRSVSFINTFDNQL